MDSLIAYLVNIDFFLMQAECLLLSVCHDMVIKDPVLWTFVYYRPFF